MEIVLNFLNKTSMRKTPGAVTPSPAPGPAATLGVLLACLVYHTDKMTHGNNLEGLVPVGLDSVLARPHSNPGRGPELLQEVSGKPRALSVLSPHQKKISLHPRITLTACQGKRESGVGEE